MAEGAGTFNLETNTVVYAKNLYERLYPASTTKILTAYIALKYCDDLDAMVTVSENAVNQASDSSVCNLKAGDVIRLRDLLYGLMLRSGNDAAVAIAEYISGDVDSFAALMNQRRQQWGDILHLSIRTAFRMRTITPGVYDMYLIFPMRSKTIPLYPSSAQPPTMLPILMLSGEAVTHTWENTNQHRPECNHRGRISDCGR